MHFSGGGGVDAPLDDVGGLLRSRGADDGTRGARTELEAETDALGEVTGSGGGTTSRADALADAEAGGRSDDVVLIVALSAVVDDGVFGTGGA